MTSLPNFVPSNQYFALFFYMHKLKLLIRWIAAAFVINSQVFQSLIEVVLYTCQRSNNDWNNIVICFCHNVKWALRPDLYNGQPSPCMYLFSILTCTAQLFLHFLHLVDKYIVEAAVMNGLVSGYVHVYSPPSIKRPPIKPPPSIKWPLSKVPI